MTSAAPASFPSVAVVICAYTSRRWNDIVRAVESVEAQAHPADEMILVIDHNADLLARAQRRWPWLTVMANRHRRGLSGARNTGIEATGSDVIAFLDDDAAGRDGWLAGLVEPYADSSVAAVGGWSHPAWTGPSRPSMLPPELWWIVGSSYRGLPTELADVRNVIGCSMSFRRSALVGVGGFNTDVGRVGSLPLGCEETELCIRVRQLDPSWRILLNPASVVDHRVSPDRERWAYLVRRSYAEGLSKAAISRTVGRGDALSSERAYTTRVLPRGALRELAAGHPSAALAIVISVGAAAAGYLRGSLRRADPTSPTPPHTVADLVVVDSDVRGAA